MAGIADFIDTLHGMGPSVAGAIKPIAPPTSPLMPTFHPGAAVNPFNDVSGALNDALKVQQMAMPAPFQAVQTPVAPPPAPSAPPAFTTLPVPPGGAGGGNAPAQPGLRHTVVYDRPFTGTPKLRTVRGVSLQPGAMAALLAVQKHGGQGIITNIVSSYRDYAAQVHTYNYNHPRGLPAAEPGSSYHEQGLAIDVNSGWIAAHPEVRTLLENAGWHSGASFNDPNHYSFGVIG